MSDEQHSFDKTVSPEVGLRIEDMCNRFERAWKHGKRPRLEDFLGDFSGPELFALARELVGIDIDYRRELGEEPRVEDYEARISILGRESIDKLISAARPPRSKAPSTVKPPPSTGAGSGKPSSVTGKKVRCPYCQNPMQLSDDASEKVLCPCCGNDFSFCETHTTQSVDLMRPLGKYQLLERVGLGGFGAVWKARDMELDRIVAIKIPHTGLMTSPTELERWHREGRAAAQLRHPGIVAVHDVTMHDGLPIMVTDFIAGVTLRDMLQVRRLSFREAAILTADIAEALDHAHSKGLVHRDVKPANIMLEPVANGDGKPEKIGPKAVEGRQHRPLVMDFGLALRADVEVLLTQDGQVIGTPAYMSPEQAAGKGHEADCRCDVYSLGVVLYELLAGELPFRGNKQMIIYQVMREDPRPLRKLNDKVPRDLETICLKALTKEPGRRYATCRDMAADLHRFLAGDPIKARPVTRVERTWRWCRRNRLAASLVAALVVVFLGGFAGVTAGWAEAVEAKKTSDEYHTTLEEQRTIREEQQHKKEQHLSDLRMDLGKRLELGLAAMKREDWQKANDEVQTVLTTIDADPDNKTDAELTDLKRRALSAHQEVVQGEAQQHRRDQLARQKADFRRLLDETLFQAADIEPETETESTRYFDATKGEKAGQAALAIADAWRPGLKELDPQDRPAIQQDVRDLLLLLVQIKLQQPGAKPADLLSLLDRARDMGGDNYSEHRLRAEVLKGDKAQANQERLLAEKTPPATAMDHFLLGQDKRQKWVRIEDDLGREVDKKKRSLLAQAAEHYQQAAMLKPDHFWAQIQLGRCYVALGQPEVGAGILETSVGLRPDSPWGYVTSGFAMMLLKRYSDAEAYLNRAHGSPAARLHLAVLHLMKGEDEVALTEFQSLLNPAKEERLAEALFYQGQLHFKQGKFPDALKDLKLFLDERKDYAPAYLVRARIYFTIGNASAGLADMMRYVEIVEPAAKGSRLLALRGRELRRSLPGWGLDRNLIALNAAKADLFTAIQTGERSAAVYDDLANVLKAIMLFHKQDHQKEILANYAEAIKLDPDDAQIRVNRGWAFKMFNDNDAARKDFAAAVKLDPSQMEAQTGLGSLLADKGDVIGASRHAELAVVYGANNYMVLHNVVCIHALLAESDPAHKREHQTQAIDMLRRAIEVWLANKVPGGPDYLQVIRDDSDLENLRGLPEYQGLFKMAGK